MRYLLSLFIVLSTCSFAVEKPEKDVVSLDSVVVYGIRSGPGLWKVSNGENTLWILGDLSPLPKKMTWESMQVESVIYDSQAFLSPPSVTADIGFFSGLSLMRSAIGIKKNPDKKKLVDVVPEDVYQRWLVLKKKYIGNSRKTEKERPIFAADKLFNKALSKIGLTYDTKVSKKVGKLAKKKKLEFINPQIKLDVSKLKTSLKNFKKTEISDLECFTRTLDTLEGDLSILKVRADAWARGDVAMLKELSYKNQDESCISAILDSDLTKDAGIENIKEKLQNLWLESAKDALTSNKSTIAILSINNLLGENSYLKLLEAEGYTVKEPN
jgi:hypothetical protein